MGAGLKNSHAAGRFAKQVFLWAGAPGSRGTLIAAQDLWARVRAPAECAVQHNVVTVLQLTET